MTFRLPPVDRRIPHAWDEVSEAKWRDLTAAVSLMRGNLGNGQAIEDAADQLRSLLRRGEDEKVIALLGSHRYSRALTWLWCERDGDCIDTISATLLAALEEKASPIAALTRENLLRVFFQRFDRLDEVDASGEVFHRLSAVLIGSGKGADAAVTFSLDGPRSVANEIRTRKLSVLEGLRLFGLDAYLDGRYVELVHQFLILEELRRIPIGADARSLEDISSAAVYDLPHLRGLLLGHAALAILIDRAGDTYPGERWRDVVVGIAGDPRIEYIAGFTKWWRVLGPRRAERVMAWLARTDLAAFLDALETYSTDVASMQRMLPPRKKLLEGLIEEGHVRRSRLFLGEDVRRHAMKGSRRLGSALLRGGQQAQKALLYLDCGDFHLVEGSDNARLWVYLRKPGERIADESVREFFYPELTRDLGAVYEERWIAEFGGYEPPGHMAITHQGYWQERFLTFLARSGVAVHHEAVLDRATYLELRRRGNIPPVRPNRIVPREEPAGGTS